MDNFYNSFFISVRLALLSMVDTVAPDIVHYYYPFIFPMSVLIGISLIVSYLLTSVIIMILNMVSLGFLNLDIHAVHQYVRVALSYLPLIEMVIARYIMRDAISDIFFAVLLKKDRLLCGTLIKHKPQRVISRYMLSFVSYLKKIPIACLILFLSYIPIVGDFVIPVLNYLSLYKYLGFTTSLILSVIIYCIPSTRMYAFFFIQYLDLSFELGADLLYPYLSRFSEHKYEKKFLRVYRVLITGFSVPYLILSSIPIVGPLMFLLAQAATPVLLCEIKQRARSTNNFDDLEAEKFFFTSLKDN